MEPVHLKKAKYLSSEKQHLFREPKISKKSKLIFGCLNKLNGLV